MAIFYFYEVKSCKEDYNSGNGLTFEGDKIILSLRQKHTRKLSKMWTMMSGYL